MNNSNRGIAQKSKFSVAIQTSTIQKMINNTLGDPKKAQRFVAAISSAVATNPALQECDHNSIIVSALLGESLGLSPSPQLGQYYLVPFNDRKTNTSKANFILGYKGYIQLAIRSGQYKKLNVLEIKAGELVSFDVLNETIKCNMIVDPEEREEAETVGYYAMFEYLNGFKKAIYWPKSQMVTHADQYSPAFNKESYKRLQNGEIAKNELWKYSSFWYKDFDEMAKKTLIRQLISKWGVMSTEIQMALENDTYTESDTHSYNYNHTRIDNKPTFIDQSQNEAEIDQSQNEAEIDQSQNEVEQIDMNSL